MTDDWGWLRWALGGAATVVAVVVSAVWAWMQRQVAALRQKDEALSQGLSEHREAVAREYVTRKELRDDIAVTNDSIQRGFDRLAGEIKGLREEVRQKADRQ